MLRSGNRLVVAGCRQPCRRPRSLLVVGDRTVLKTIPCLSTEAQSDRAPRPRATTAVGVLRQKVSLYSSLSKSRLTSLVVATAGFGFLMAGPPMLGPLAAVTVGTGLASASASTWNQVYERFNDSKMRRTLARPMPAGRLSQREAICFGAVTGAAGVGILALGCDTLVPAALGAGNIVLYGAIYTPWKQWHPSSTVVGSVVGAIPPLIGYAGAGGSLCNPAAAALFGTLFLWQMPHFYALAWRFREDYARGGFRMISLNDVAGKATSGRTLAYSLGLAALPLATTLAGVTGSMFAVEGLALNAYFLPLAWRFFQNSSDKNARSLFLATLWYLPVFMACMVYHSEAWRSKEEVLEESATTPGGRGAWEVKFEKSVDDARRALRDACPHEWAKEERLHEALYHQRADPTRTSEATARAAVAQACPVVVAEQSASQVQQAADRAVSSHTSGGAGESVTWNRP